MSAGLPPIVPSASMDEDARFVNGAGGSQEVGCCGEVFVTTGEDLGVEG